MSNSRQFSSRRAAALGGILAFVCAAGIAAVPAHEATAEPLAAGDRTGPDRRHSRVMLRTGVELHVVEAGPKDGRPVLLLHGFTDSWHTFEPVLHRLPPGVRAIVPSQRGHGDSERPECCFTPADFAEDAVALLDALGLPSADVVGHSMGSFVAQLMASEHPERVERLVLVGSGHTTRVPVVADFSAAVMSLTDPIDPSFVREFQASTAAGPLPPALLEVATAESLKVPARVWRETLGGLLELKVDLARIEAATLLISGDRDGFWVPDHVRTLAEAIPGARMELYPGVGHAPHWERPDRFAADLFGFLAQTAR